MKKRGQFYIVAAVIIVMVVSSMASVSVYTAVKPSKSTISELSDDLNREGFKIVEYGIYNNENVGDLMGDFIGEDVADYFLKKSDDADIVYLFGDKDNLKSIHYVTEDTGSISVGGSGWNQFDTHSVIRDVQVQGDQLISVDIQGREYSFDLTNNQMFYFVIVDLEGKESFVKVSHENVGRGEGN